MPKSGDGVGGYLVAISFGDCDGGTGGGEGLGDGVAGFGGTNEEEGFAGGFGQEGVSERFADVLRWDEVDGKADVVGGAQSGGTDGGDVFGELSEAEELGAAVEGFDGVGAGEEEPVVGAEAGEGGVETGEGSRGRDLDGRDEDSGRSERFKLCCEFGGLVAGSSDEDAFVGERHLGLIVTTRQLAVWFLLQQFGVEALVDLTLVSGVAIGLEGFDQGAEAWGENDEISPAGCGGVGVGRACWDKYRCSGPSGFGLVCVAEGELAFEDVPCLVIRMMDVERGRTTAAPLVDFKRSACRGERSGLHANDPITFCDR